MTRIYVKPIVLNLNDSLPNAFGECGNGSAAAGNGPGCNSGAVAGGSGGASVRGCQNGYTATNWPLNKTFSACGVGTIPTT